MKVLIATDGSSASLTAAREALHLLHPDAELEVVRAIPAEEDPNESAGGFEGPLITEEEAHATYRADRERAESDIAATVDRLGEPATITVVEGGHAGRQICDLAGERAADVLVVGASDKGWFRRLIAGSVMEYAAHNAPCPVLIVRHETD